MEFSLTEFAVLRLVL